MHWVLLYVAIAFEVFGTISLRLSHGLGKPKWFVAAVVAYLACFAALSKTFDKISVGVTYAIWSGIGTLMIVAFGVYSFKEPMNLSRGIFVVLIIIGAVGLNLTTPVKS